MSLSLSLSLSPAEKMTESLEKIVNDDDNMSDDYDELILIMSALRINKNANVSYIVKQFD